MKLRDMSRDLRWMMFAVIVANTSSRMMQPFIPLYLETIGASVAQVGLYFTIAILFGIIFRVFGGWISDNVGRLQTMAVGSIFGTLATLAFVLAPTWELAIVSALLSGIGTALVSPSYQAYVAEEAPQGAVGSTFGLIESLFLICQIIGPLLGGFLVESAGYRIMLWSAFGIMIVATIVRIGLIGNKPNHIQRLSINGLSHDMRKTVAFLMAGGLITWMFLADGLLDASSQSVMPFMPKYATEVAGLTESGYGGLIAFLSLIAVMTNWLGGLFADRYGNHISIALGALLGGSAFFMLAVSTTTLSLIVGFGIMGVSGAFIQPAFSSLLSQVAPKDQLGMMYGLFNSAMGLVAIPAPSIGGTLYDRVGPRATLAFGIVLSLISIPLVLIKLRPHKAKRSGED
jgi:MFS family permease